MEIEGHPTQDLVEELQRRGSLPVSGGSDGPNPDALKFVIERHGESRGAWLFIPEQAYETGFDEFPGAG